MGLLIFLGTATTAPPAGSGMLLAACVLLGVFAIAAVCGIASARRKARMAARLAHSRGEGLRELLRTVRMAETIAGIGVWQYDPATGTQQWSDGLKRLFGIDGTSELLAGDAEELLYASDVDLVRMAQANRDAVGPYALTFAIRCLDGPLRNIRFQACNLRNRDGSVRRVVAVARDLAERELAPLGERRSEGAAPMLETPRAYDRSCGTIDPVTGLPDRRQIMRELDRMVIEARVRGEPLVLAIFAIDHFDRVKARHGKAIGELALYQVARIADAKVRVDDLVGRVGDEEFAWVIPGVVEGTARVMAERLRQAIARDSAAGSAPAVTASLGFARMRPGDSALTLFGRADAALGEAKRAGTNRVRVAA